MFRGRVAITRSQIRVRHVLGHLSPQSTANDNNNKHCNVADDQRNVADIGGSDKFKNDKLDISDRYLTDWEKQMDSLLLVLLSKGFTSTHETRREWEKLPFSSYIGITYYQEWLFSIISLCIDNNLIAESEIHDELQKYLSNNVNNPRLIECGKQRFKKGDQIIIRDVSSYLLKYSNWRNFLGIPKLIHHRVPQYAQNKYGEIVEYIGNYSDPKLEAFGIDTTNIPKIPLYRVKVFVNNNEVILDVLQHWMVLQDIETADDDEEHHSHHHDDDGHDHKHEKREIVEQNAIRREPSLSPYEIISKIVINLLTTKNIITMNELRNQIAVVDANQHKNFGAELVVRCWRDPQFKNKFIKNAKEVLLTEVDENGNLKYDTGIGEPCELRVVENTENVHHLICCTLCSCYPRNLMGIPPDWYKSKKYRSECISNPRKLLKEEFNTELAESMKLIVCDSNSELRYMVLPHLPSQIPGWEKMNDEQLRKLITRDMLIGTKRIGNNLLTARMAPETRTKS